MNYYLAEIYFEDLKQRGNKVSYYETISRLVISDTMYNAEILVNDWFKSNYDIINYRLVSILIHPTIGEQG